MHRRFLYLLLIVVVIILWEYFGSTSNTFRLLLSSPSLSYTFFVENAKELLHATGITFAESFFGLLIATIFSFAVMIICLYYPKMMGYILPIMVSSQVVPLIVLAPFFIILLGLGIASKVAMSALLCFFPVFVNFAQGYQGISSNIHDLLVINNAGKWASIRRVYFPLSLPSIFAGLKVSTTLSVIGAIVAEFTGAESGLGKNLFLAAKRLEPELMMTSLLLSAVLGGSMFLLIRLLEQRIGYWYKRRI